MAEERYRVHNARPMKVGPELLVFDIIEPCQELLQRGRLLFGSPDDDIFIASGRRHLRRVSPELGPRGRTAPQPPSPDSLARLRASVSLAILAQIDGPEAGEEGPGPRRVDRLTTGDSPGLGQSCGRAIPPRRREASTGVEGPLGESRGLSSEADAASGHDDPQTRTERTGPPPTRTPPEQARRAAPAGRLSRHGRASSGLLAHSAPLRAARPAEVSR